MPAKAKPPTRQEVANGSVVIPIYPTPSHGRAGWTVCHYRNGARVRRWFADQEAAVSYAEDEAERLGNNEITISGERAAQLVRFEDWARRARRSGSSLESLVERLEAARAATSSKDVGELVDEFLAIKAQIVHPRWHEMKATMLTRFHEAFVGPLAQVTPEGVQRWLDGLKDADGEPLGARSKINHRDEIRALFRFARRRKYVAADWDVMAGVELPEAPPGKIQPYSPEDVDQLLQYAAEHASQWVPYLAIRALSGVRFEESLRLVGRHIHLPTRYIAMEADITKTATRRLVPILPALAAWLRKFRPAPDAPIAPYTSSRVMGDRLVALIRRAGLENRHNGLRDAYVSYRMAQTRDIARTADESGNSPEMIRQSYREVRLPDGRVITPKLATMYFATRPPRRANIIQLKQQAQG